MTYPGSHSPYPQPPHEERSAWSSPVVWVAVAAGVLLVIGGVLAAVILIPRSESATQAGSSTSATPMTSLVTSYVTSPPPTPGGSAAGAPSAAVPAPPHSQPTHSDPPVAGADWQGFIDGPRCNAAGDAAVAVGYTSRSRVVICQVGSRTGQYYYKGSADGNTVEIDFPQRSGESFTAVNKGYSYTVSPAALVIAKGGQTLTTEPMIDYWSN